MKKIVIRWLYVKLVFHFLWFSWTRRLRIVDGSNLLMGEGRKWCLLNGVDRSESLRNSLPQEVKDEVEKLRHYSDNLYTGFKPPSEKLCKEIGRIMQKLADLGEGNVGEGLTVL